MLEYMNPTKLEKSRCPICREIALKAIGVDPEHPVIRDNIVVKCDICGTQSYLNRNTFIPGDIPPGTPHPMIKR